MKEPESMEHNILRDIFLSLSSSELEIFMCGNSGDQAKGHF